MARKKRKPASLATLDQETLEVPEEEDPNDFESILELNQDGFLVVEGETRQILWANRAASRLLKKKPEKILAEPFPEDLDDGPMRTLDLNKKVHSIQWQGQPCHLMVLTTLSSGGASFSLEWRLEAAEERAREAEETVASLKAQLQSLPAPVVHSDREVELEAELQSLLSRLASLEKDFQDSEERVQRAEERAREAESLMEEAESQAQETERHLEDLSDSVRKVEEELEVSRRQVALLEQGQSATLAEERALFQAELEGLREKCAEAERQGSEASSEIASLREEAVLLRRQLEDWHEKESVWQQRESEVQEMELVHLQALTELEELRFEQQQLREAGPDPALQELQNELHELRERRDFLEIERAELEEKLQEQALQLEAARNQSGETLQALEEVSEQRRQRLDELEFQLTESQTLAELLQLEVSELQEIKAQQKEASGAQQERIQELQSTLQHLEDQVLELQLSLEEKADLARQLEDAAEGRRLLEAELAQLRSGSSEAAQLQADLDDVHQHLGMVEKERDDLLRNLEKVELRLQELESERLEIQASKDSTCAEIETLQQAVARLQEELEATRGELALRPEVDLEALHSQSQALTEEMERLQARCQSLEQEKDQFFGEAEARAGELEQQAAQHQLLSQELEESKSQNTLLQEQLDDLLEQVEQSSALEIEVGRLQTRIRELEAVPAASVEDEELARLRQAVEDLQGRVREQDSQLEVAEQNLQEARAELQARGGEAERVVVLEAELEKVRQQLSELPASEAPATAVAGETEQLAFEDRLTGLANQNLLRRFLDGLLKQVDRYQRRCALIHVDIDRFGALNEALGTEAGDAVLQELGTRLREVVRASDVLCRRTEDEFLILLSEVSGEPDAPDSISVVVKRIQEIVAPPFNAAGQPVLISCSLGISQFPSDAKDGDELLENAARAMRRAKELGRNQAQFFTEDLQKRYEARHLLQSELRKALDLRQFQLLYQPIVHLPTGRIAGVESLLRWNHPAYGVQTPDSFLDVAEDSGLMNPIGRWVIVQAAQQLFDWARQGLDLFVTVNLSPRQFLQADLVDTIRRALETTGAPAHNFVVEVPEAVQMLDIQRVQGILLALRQAGIRVALDRFGSGFSSLERLHSELITLLKIDRKFLFHAATNAAALNVTVAALGVARGLRLRPVAVGVENETQLSLCRQLECEYVQGNLVYVPTDAAQVSELARAGRLLR